MKVIASWMRGLKNFCSQFVEGGRMRVSTYIEEDDYSKLSICKNCGVVADSGTSFVCKECGGESPIEVVGRRVKRIVHKWNPNIPCNLEFETLLRIELTEPYKQHQSFVDEGMNHGKEEGSKEEGSKEEGSKEEGSKEESQKEGEEESQKESEG